MYIFTIISFSIALYFVFVNIVGLFLYIKSYIIPKHSYDLDLLITRGAFENMKEYYNIWKDVYIPSNEDFLTIKNMLSNNYITPKYLYNILNSKLVFNQSIMFDRPQSIEIIDIVRNIPNCDNLFKILFPCIIDINYAWNHIVKHNYHISAYYNIDIYSNTNILEQYEKIWITHKINSIPPGLYLPECLICTLKIKSKGCFSICNQCGVHTHMHCYNNYVRSSSSSNYYKAKNKCYHCNADNYQYLSFKVKSERTLDNIIVDNRQIYGF